MFEERPLLGLALGIGVAVGLAGLGELVGAVVRRRRAARPTPAVRAPAELRAG